MGRPGVGLDRAGRWAAVRPGPSNSNLVGRSPARPINIFRRWAAARPSPSHFQKFLARPGPAHHMVTRPMKHGLYMGRPGNYVGRSVDLTGRPMGRPMCCSVPKRALHTTPTCIFNVTCWFLLFIPVWVPWDSCFRPMRHIACTHYSHNAAPSTTRSDGFLWATTSSCCYSARSSNRARTSCYLRRRDGKECRLYTHNGTKALIRHLHKTRHHIIFYARGDLLEIHRTNVAVSGG